MAQATDISIEDLVTLQEIAETVHAKTGLLKTADSIRKLLLYQRRRPPVARIVRIPAPVVQMQKVLAVSPDDAELIVRWYAEGR